MHDCFGKTVDNAKLPMHDSMTSLEPRNSIWMYTDFPKNGLFFVEEKKQEMEQNNIGHVQLSVPAALLLQCLLSSK